MRLTARYTRPGASTPLPDIDLATQDHTGRDDSMVACAKQFHSADTSNYPIRSHRGACPVSWKSVVYY
jgi:hypothetical protein